MKKLNALLVFITPLVLITMATIIQGHWALWEYRTAPSSSCMDCDIFSDLLLSSLLPLIGWLLLQLLLLWRKPTLRIKTACLVTLLFVSWACINTQIFDEREASWSTYTHIWMIGLSLSFIPSIVLGGVTGFLYYLMKIKVDNED